MHYDTPSILASIKVAGVETFRESIAARSFKVLANLPLYFMHGTRP